jgi:hypothetical protein
MEAAKAQNWAVDPQEKKKKKERKKERKRAAVTGGWRKLSNDKLRNLCSSPSIIRMIKSRRMRWAGNAARLWRRERHIGC